MYIIISLYDIMTDEIDDAPFFFFLGKLFFLFSTQITKRNNYLENLNLYICIC